MCVKEINRYVMCGCQDTVVHIRTCADKLLKDEFGGTYGYASCPDSEMGHETRDPRMSGWCPRCALNNLVVFDNKLVPKPISEMKMVPATLLPRKVKAGKGKHGQSNVDNKGNKSSGQQDAISTGDQTQLVELMT